MTPLPLRRVAALFAAITCIALASADPTAPPLDPRAVADALFDHAADLLLKDPTAAKPEFARAASAYELLIPETPGQHARASIFYNAGAAHQLSGNLGRAVLDFRRAELLAPATPGLRQRAAAARAEAKGEVALTTITESPDASQWFRDQLRSIPRAFRWHALTITSIAFWCVLLLRVLLPPLSRWRPRPLLLWIPGLAALLCLPMLATLWQQDTLARAEVVVLSETIGRTEPDELTGAPSASSSFKPGRELRVLEDRIGGTGQPWLHVAAEQVPDAVEAAIWIPGSSAAHVLDPSTPVLAAR